VGILQASREKNRKLENNDGSIWRFGGKYAVAFLDESKKVGYNETMNIL
jgi:hypothetical protein